ncbi:MAG: Clp protease ClpP [Methylococcales bacterium]|jgi:ATP-dependent Clp protease, protease subunit|nr:Clp protease ClpP [Methylococcales bacterium]
MKTGYEIKAQDTTAEIMIYDAIGSGMFGGVSAKDFVTDLKQLTGVANITVRLNSPGGEVFDGTAIYNALINHPANIEVHIDGMALSMASVIAMAGNKVVMAENAMMMIHDPSISVSGSASQLRKTADTLEKTKAAIVNAYARKTGKQQDELSALMSVETWMSADEALCHGFIDEVSSPIEMAAHFDLSPFNFKHVPEQLSKAPDQPLDLAQIEALKIEAVNNERKRVQSIIDIANIVNQPRLATAFIDQGVSVDEARDKLFKASEKEQEETIISSQVPPLPEDTNPLSKDAENRSQ